jgi:hypothetical protein
LNDNLFEATFNSENEYVTLINSTLNHSAPDVFYKNSLLVNATVSVTGLAGAGQSSLDLTCSDKPSGLNSFEDIREGRFTIDDLKDVEKCSIKSLKVKGHNNILNVGGTFESIQLESSTFKTLGKSSVSSVIMKDSTIEAARYNGGSINLDQCSFQVNSALEKSVNADFICHDSTAEISNLQGDVKLDMKNKCEINIEESLESSILKCDNGSFHAEAVSGSNIQISESDIYLNLVMDSTLNSSLERISPVGSSVLNLIDGSYSGAGQRCNYDTSDERWYCEDLP